jgi:uncharacterized protein YutE (UPF0331/DUF86 family)
MTHLADRLAELQRHLRHLEDLRPRIAGAGALQQDLSLHNDVLFSLLVVSQSVIDVASELAARRGIRFTDYTAAVRALAGIDGFSPDLVDRLSRIQGFRNVLIHEYVAIDYARVLEALDELEPVAEFGRIVARREGDPAGQS